MNLLAKLESLRNAKAETVTPYRPSEEIAPIPAATAPVPAPAPVGDMASIAAAVAASNPHAFAAPGQPFRVHAAGPEAALQPGVHIAQASPAAINPPARRPPGRPRKTNPDAPIGLMPTEMALPPAPAQAPPAQPSAPPPAPPPAPPQASPSALSAATPPPATDASAELAASLAKPAPSTDHQIEALLVGVFVRGDLGLTVTEFETLWTRARAIVGEAVFYRDYGYKTDGYMAAALRDVINADKPVAINVPDPRAPEATKALTYLRSIARTCVEAVR